MKRRNNTPEKLSEANQALLETFKEDAIKNNVRISEQQFEALEKVYNAITRRTLSKGCSSCIPAAFVIIRNYLAIFPDPKPKVLSKNTKRLKPIKKEDKKKTEAIAEAVTESNETGKPFVFPDDLDNKEKLSEEVIDVVEKEDSESKEIVKEIKKETPKKKAPAKKKKPAQKSNAKASPRERRKRK